MGFIERNEEISKEEFIEKTSKMHKEFADLYRSTGLVGISEYGVHLNTKQFMEFFHLEGEFFQEGCYVDDLSTVVSSEKRVVIDVDGTLFYTLLDREEVEEYL